MKTHIHVYRVTLKAEVDSDEFESVEDAEKQALKLAESGELNFGESDCKFMALGFDVSK